jgi:hypothetical protein
MLKPDGVAIDGVADDLGNIKEVGGSPVFFDVPDPSFGLLLPFFNWQQVSGVGDAGSLVYVGQIDGAQSVQHPLIYPYYNDDKCFDDGTGDDPVKRPWPGEATTDDRVRDAYAALAGKPYDDVTCDEKQGAWGAHGIHYMFTNDTDNAFQSKPLTEVESTEWQFAVPTREPHAVGEPYANVVRVPLMAVATNRTEASVVPTYHDVGMHLSIP